MYTVTQEVYDRIDNAFYNAPEDIWWREDKFLSLLRTSLNPCRFGYISRIWRDELKRGTKDVTVLDVGCGGGILAEEVAASGFTVTGIDPAGNALNVARSHAERQGLSIDYRIGSGEAIPFPDNSFDMVYCCDVLEHVRDLDKCIHEISRVLKPGGAFFFDTFNRTFLSKLIVIKLWQEWKSTAFMQPHLHVFEMFIKPAELNEVCALAGLEVRNFTGMVPDRNPLAMIRLLRQRAKGKLTFAQLGQRFKLRPGRDLKVGYMGYAIKR